jgi:hypothetical protein
MVCTTSSTVRLTSISHFHVSLVVGFCAYEQYS